MFSWSMVWGKRREDLKTKGWKAGKRAWRDYSQYLFHVFIITPLSPQKGWSLMPINFRKYFTPCSSSTNILQVYLLPTKLRNNFEKLQETEMRKAWIKWEEHFLKMSPWRYYCRCMYRTCMYIHIDQSIRYSTATTTNLN